MYPKNKVVKKLGCSVVVSITILSVVLSTDLDSIVLKVDANQLTGLYLDCTIIHPVDIVTIGSHLVVSSSIFKQFL
jgi:hypothetical protein